ncbi:hypothetical protein D3C72_1974510 [compost metagenome]
MKSRRIHADHKIQIGYQIQFLPQRKFAYGIIGVGKSLSPVLGNLELLFATAEQQNIIAIVREFVYHIFHFGLRENLITMLCKWRNANFLSIEVCEHTKSSFGYILQIRNQFFAELKFEA